MKINKRIVITTTALGGFSLLLLGALVVPTVFAIQDYKAKIADTHLAIETRYALRRQTRDAVGKLEDIRQRMTSLPLSRIREGNEIDFVDALDSAASASNITADVTLETVNQRQLSPWENETPIRIRAVGDLRDIIIYLSNIERLSYVIHFRTMDIATLSSRDSAGSGKVEAVISGAVRWISKDLPVFKTLDITPEEPPKL